MIQGQHLPVICQKCKHTWESEFVVGVAINVFTAHLKNMFCPKCGADWKKLSMKTSSIETTISKESPS